MSPYFFSTSVISFWMAWIWSFFAFSSRAISSLQKYAEFYFIFIQKYVKLFYLNEKKRMKVLRGWTFQMNVSFFNAFAIDMQLWKFEGGTSTQHLEFMHIHLRKARTLYLHTSFASLAPSFFLHGLAMQPVSCGVRIHTLSVTALDCGPVPRSLLVLPQISPLP